MSPDFIPIPRERVIRPPYTSYWLGPFGGLAVFCVASLGLAWWLWRHAPLIDDCDER